MKKARIWNAGLFVYGCNYRHSVSPHPHNPIWDKPKYGVSVQASNLKKLKHLMNSQQCCTATTTPGTAEFGKCPTSSTRLFRINPGISCDDALAQASVLMDCINRLTLLGGADTADSAPIWAAHYLGEQVKAIIDDVAVGLRGGRGLV